jgi:hypothetical protein
LEYGIWRISTFGINVTGDKSLVAKKEEERAVQRRNQDAFLSFMLQGGVTILPDMDQSIGYNATFKLVLFRYATLGASFFGNGLDYNQLLTSIGGIVPVRLGSVTLMPFAEVGFGTTLGKSKSGPKKAEDDDWGYDAVAFDNEIDFGIGVGVQAGLVITADAVKGLYLYGNYQYNSMLMYNNNPNIDVKDYTLNNNIISIGIGYSF